MLAMFVALSSNETAVDRIRQLRRCRIRVAILTVLMVVSAMVWALMPTRTPYNLCAPYVLALAVVCATGAVVTLMRVIDLLGDIRRNFIAAGEILDLDYEVFTDYRMSSPQESGPYYASDSLFRDQLTADKSKDQTTNNRDVDGVR